MRNLFVVLILVTLSLPCTPVGAAVKPPRLAGTWSISWQARIGMERGTIVLRQKGSHLTGDFQGLGAPGLVSGDIKDSNVTLGIEFQAKVPYTILFSGTVDGDKMAGKFQFQGMKDGYDQHGENVQAIDYSWKATRAQQKSSDQQQKPAR